MPNRDYNYQELVRLARMCWGMAMSTADDVAGELRRMAREYQHEAAKLDGGKLPNLEDDNGNKPLV
jgi:hypothetical protein